MAEENKPTDPASLKLTPQDVTSVTKHTVRINGRALKYTVTCGSVVLHEEHDKDGEALDARARASMFFIAYTLDGVRDPARRPITYSFNGGPGSSSVWLHLGLLGPKRVQLDREGHAGAPPYALVDNEHSIFDKTDLVFIDPIGTGYSRMVAGEKVKEFTITSAIWRAWASSSGSTPRATNAGPAPNTSRARVTAPRAPVVWRASCRRSTPCT